MKQYTTIKNVTKFVIGFSVICLFVAGFYTNSYLKADDLEIDYNITPSNIGNFGTFLDRGLEFLEYFLGSIAFIGVVISAIQFGIAGGNAEKAAKAKKSLMYSAIGVFLAVLSYAITRAVFGVLSGE